MAYIPPQLQVDTDADNRLQQGMLIGMQGWGGLGDLRRKALEMEEERKRGDAKEKSTKAEIYMKDGAGQSAVKKFMEGDASEIQDFYSSKYNTKSETDRIAAGNESAYKQAQIDKMKQEASNPERNLTFEDKEAIKAKYRQQSQEEKQPAQNEFAAAGYSKRARQAEEEFSKLPAGTGTDWKARVFSILPNEVAPENLQMLDQAKRNFISANLRKESGAAISDQEYSNEDKKYFPQPGDSEGVIAQKARARQQAMLNLEAEGARALPRVGDAPRAQVNVAQKVKSYSPEQLAQRKAELLKKMQMSEQLAGR